MEPKLLSIVMPVFNEEEGLPSLFEHLDRFLSSLREIKVETIFVDDCSTDGSPDILQNYCNTGSSKYFVRLSRNSGSHIAIIAGLSQAHGDCAVFMASDLQDPPELIIEMLAKWDAGSNVVWAVRRHREGVSNREVFFSNTFYWLLNNFSSARFPPKGADFALLDRTVIDALLLSTSANPSLGIDIATLGFTQGQIEYVKKSRRFGKSSWNLSRKLKAFADAFVSSTFLPLRLMSYLGLMCSGAGFIYALVVIFYKLVSKTNEIGWPSLMVAILVLGGIQMTMLGVIGEYLWRTLEAARKAPLFYLERPNENASMHRREINDETRPISR
jgi:dolichol-phosphate mannosyltransferase